MNDDNFLENLSGITQMMSEVNLKSNNKHKKEGKENIESNIEVIENYQIEEDFGFEIYDN